MLIVNEITDYKSDLFFSSIYKYRHKISNQPNE